MRVVSAVTAGLGLVGLLAGPGAAADLPGSGAPKPVRSAVGWGPCSAEQKELNEAGAECAKVAVPLDYADPRGRTIDIAVSRIRAKSSGERRGILLSNPGGPGGTGLANTLALRPALKDVADHYDLIGFDPRFLGESTPLTCGEAPQPAPPAETTTPRRDFGKSVRSARDTARRCQEHGDNAELLPHASTRNVARDMDAIREALGERRLSYYGISYGADLGAVYTQLFPHRSDRIVLDSSTDPAATQYELFQRSGAPAEAALDGLGGHVRDDVLKLLARAERHPIPVKNVRLDAPLLRILLKQLVQHEEYDPQLVSVVDDVKKAAAGEEFEPGPALSGLLDLLSSPELADSMTGGAIFMCGDGGWPAGGWPKKPATYWKNMQRSRATQPVFGPYVNGMIAPCAFWGTEPREPGTRIRNDVPVLLLQAKYDNNVPYEGALALHKKLRGSRLVTADIRSHGVYGRGTSGLTPVPCADGAVNTYLRDGELPRADITCAKPNLKPNLKTTEKTQ
ncbi:MULTISPECIES: alpha/beta hydrolase [Streptomyces]|uniref:Alpha/beta hydrolase n=1 Tax=Streptomyces venezuelae TaxID=54571 RepID=A0A5P2B8N7_STRVZ|nr:MULTISPECIES: alpha/beta hydrolase [Streptomyces]NDZ99492.1 alpha/beta hydrolase [Streptomyces sp. SID10116]MYY82325.1 alpha/beta fold hydrolase [Streptomyces sp. SID335]NDZ89728.1 alpha/beta hydrolase [Streptomyces sp. SID10115]NEB43288.1 alpha/beta hydrolase [Streptomyces sp. SID339]QES26148.1 alpha/beta hydrolase [Streptomyces venezuelae]